MVSRVSRDVVFTDAMLRSLAIHGIQLVGSMDGPPPFAPDPKAETDAMIGKHAVCLENRIRNGAQGTMNGKLHYRP